MPEPSSLQRLLRERTLNRYITALEKGDLDALGDIMKRAERDALLEAMILELHESYQTDGQFLALVQEENAMEIEGGIHKSRPAGEVSGPEQQQEPDYTPAPRPRKSPLWFQVLAALLLLACLIGGVLLYMRFQRSSQTATHPAAVVHYNLCLGSIAPTGSQSSHLELNGVAAISPNNVWAVGSETSNTLYSGPISALIEHWDGTRWKIVPGADAGALARSIARNVTVTGTTFASLAAISADDIWAAGSMYVAEKSAVVNHSLIEHWDGKKWQVVTGPDSAIQGSFLENVQAVSANDVWAVGFAIPANVVPFAITPLVEHWDGSRWSLMSMPASFQGAFLYAVSAVSPNDVWIAGSLSAGASEGPLLAHWNGQSWQTSTLPDALVGSASDLLALKAISTNDVWAVGGLASGTINDRRATPMMIMHWDGRRWNATPEPAGASLQAIAASNSRDVWAVGKSVTNQALVEHWDGQRWSSIPQSQHRSAILTGVSIAGDKVWIVGNTEEMNNNGRAAITGAFVESSC